MGFDRADPIRYLRISELHVGLAFAQRLRGSNFLKPKPDSSQQFDFGENWQNFSANALTDDRVSQAAKDLENLCSGIELRNRLFLDIGFGQGLSLLSAAMMGAKTVGCDINPKCATVLDRNRAFFPSLKFTPKVVVGSILEDSVVHVLRTFGNDEGAYEIVHSWGVLHHTGEMEKGIRHAASLVAPGGFFILAIYNRHWSSLIWSYIKWTYVKLPKWAQKATIWLLFPVIYAAKWLVTGKDPKIQERGMDFYYNVVDWVGGHPYEYATRESIVSAVAGLGFSAVRVIPAIVPTGCNQFVFRRDYTQGERPDPT